MALPQWRKTSAPISTPGLNSFGYMSLPLGLWALQLWSQEQGGPSFLESWLGMKSPSCAEPARRSHPHSHGILWPTQDPSFQGLRVAWSPLLWGALSQPGAGPDPTCKLPGHSTCCSDTCSGPYCPMSHKPRNMASTSSPIPRSHPSPYSSGSPCCPAPSLFLQVLAPREAPPTPRCCPPSLCSQNSSPQGQAGPTQDTHSTPQLVANPDRAFGGGSTVYSVAWHWWMEDEGPGYYKQLWDQDGAWVGLCPLPHIPGQSLVGGVWAGHPQNT